VQEYRQLRSIREGTARVIAARAGSVAAPAGQRERREIGCGNTFDVAVIVRGIPFVSLRERREQEE